MTALFALGTVTTRSRDVGGWTVTLRIPQPATTSERVPAVGIVQVD